MRKASMIDMNEVEKWYAITEDGCVYSKIRKRWLKPQVNNYGYVHYCLSGGLDRATWVFAHTLVALKYIGSPPSDRHEIDHLDDNKSNNHYSNLVWRTHSENVLESFRRGRRGYWLGKNKDNYPVSLATRILMSNAKKKPVVFEGDGQRIVFDSIEDAAVGLNTYRKKIYLYIKGNRTFDGGILRFVEESV